MSPLMMPPLMMRRCSKGWVLRDSVEDDSANYTDQTGKAALSVHGLIPAQQQIRPLGCYDRVKILVLLNHASFGRAESRLDCSTGEL